MKSYYQAENLNKIPELIKLSPEAATSYLDFEQQVYKKSNHLPEQTKELIAIAVAHVTGCPYCIDVHVKKYRALGGSKEAIVEAILVAASTRAGAILSHGVHALISFDAEEIRPEKKNGQSKEGMNNSGGPECFC